MEEKPTVGKTPWDLIDKLFHLFKDSPLACVLLLILIAMISVIYFKPKLIVPNKNISFKDSKVGIGTKEPLTLLHLNENIGRTTLRVQNSNLNASGSEQDANVELVNTSRSWTVQCQTSGDFQVNDNIASATRLSINKEGKVGIGTTDPKEKLFVNGNICANNFHCKSSIRWKKNIQPLSNALKKVMQLNGVYYKSRIGGIRSIGFIAEEAGKIIPETVKYDENNKYAISMDYTRLTALLNEAIKEQQILIQNQQRMINALSERIAALENRY